MNGANLLLAVPVVILCGSMFPEGAAARQQNRMGAMEWEQILKRNADFYRRRIETHRQKVLRQIGARSIPSDNAELMLIRQAGIDFAEEVNRAAESLGENHLVVLEFRESLASLHRTRQAWSDSKQQQSMIVSIRTRLNGVEHPETIAAVELLANDVSLLGEREETVKLRRSIYEARKRSLGAVPK